MTSLSPSNWVQTHLLADRALQPVAAHAKAYAPANIALSKYWGMREGTFNLPVTGSLSISLAEHGTHTQLTPIDAAQHQVCLNGELLSADSTFVSKVTSWLDLFLAPGHALQIDTHNTIPTAAGLASSASGFGALSLACNELFDWQLSLSELSALARMGSGSASRSLWHGFVKWHAGSASDGHDSIASPMAQQWPDLRIGLVTIDSHSKAVSSREGMQRTVQTSRLYEQWPVQANADMLLIEQAINGHDFSLLGRTAEQDAMAMHATMAAAWPPLVYWQAESITAMQKVWQLRADGVEVYLTMDAGPNLKLLFESAQEALVRDAFAQLTVIAPFQPPAHLQQPT